MPITTAFNHTADLDKGAANVLLRQPLSTLDANAHVFVVEARRGSEPADLTGARCEGWFVRADGVTVPIDGEVDGSTATVTLLPACYAVPGRFALAVKLALGDVIHTILRAEGSIDVSRTDALTEGGTGVQSFDEIVASLDAIFSAAESAGTDAQRAEDAAASIIGSVEAAQDAATRAEAAAERAEQIGGAGGGTPGGYYTPSVTQTDDATMRVSYQASTEGMPSVSAVDITLPAGPAGYTPVKGKDYFDGEPGRTPVKGVDYFDGDPGVSPTVTPSKSGKVTTITIKDASGTKTATISDGEDGSDATVTQESIENALGYTPADETKVFESGEIATFVNIFDTVEIEYGKLINTTDKTIEDTTANLATTGFIPVKAGSIIRVNEDFLISATGTPSYILYDADKNPLQAYRTSSINSTGYYASLVEADSNGYIVSFQINKPSATAYIRITNDSRLIGGNPILTVDEEIEYVTGYGTALNRNVKVDYSQITNAPQKNGWSILPYEHLAICYSGINRKPINTVEHFVDAAENFGYNALKCDVRPTSDGELVCCHDAGFTFDGSGYITDYDSSNQTKIHDVTAATCLSYSFKTGEHPCLIGDYLDVCRKYGKVAFITIRNEYMDVVIPKLLDELRKHNMTYSTIINSMTYESLVQWRQQDQAVMINYTLAFGAAIDQAQIDKAVGLGYCSLCGFSLPSASTDPSAVCDFEYARENGIRLLQAIAYKEGSPEACFAMGYDGCQIGIPWGSPAGGGVSEDAVQTMIDTAIGSAIGGAY